MKIWAVANQKGGVGKTTTAVSLAGVLHNRHMRVLLVDLDPHGSLTSYFGTDPDSVQVSGYNLFHQTSPVHAVIKHSKFENIDFIPASSALATLDRQLGAKDGMGLVMKKTLDQVKPNYDVAIMDCPPMLGLLMVNALAACERLLIPVQTEFLALKGLERMVHTLGMIQKARKQNIQYTIVPTFYDARLHASIEALNTLRASYDSGCLWEGLIPVDTQFRDASREGVPLTIARPSGRGGRAYSYLLDYLLNTNETESIPEAGEHAL